MGGIARDGAHYRIGPLTTYARADQLREWHENAAPGDRCIYAIGPALGSDPVAALARKMGEDGTVHLSRERDGRGWRYFMEKRPTPGVKSAGTIRLAEAEARLLQVLTVLADRCAALPTLEVLAESAGLPHRQAADYRLQQLVKRGLVKLRSEGEARFVDIIATDDHRAVSS